jgi:hypothetical protein
MKINKPAISNRVKSVAFFLANKKEKISNTHIDKRHHMIIKNLVSWILEIVTEKVKILHVNRFAHSDYGW